MPRATRTARASAQKASVRPVTARASALQGSLSDLPLPDLLTFLAGSGAGGVARLTGPVPGEVHVEGGRVLLADTEGDPTLEAHLRAGGFSSDLLDTAAAAVARGVGWADALVDAGASAVEVRSAIYEHTANALFELLAAPDDQFSFESEVASPTGTRFPMDPEPLLADAERRRRQWATIASTIPSTAVVLRLVATLPAGCTAATISADDWPVLAALDGQRMLSDVVRELGRTSFRVCETAARLLGDGVVERI